ncbi:MAG: hypothetical protein AAF604_10970 [Acidobacteriota bacterium]
MRHPSLTRALATAALLLACLPAGAQRFSEENPPSTCGKNLLAGITCSGRYCDNLALRCGSRSYDLYDIEWSRRFVSEEGEGTASCHVSNPFERGDLPHGEPAFITGLACNGRYCDNLALECVALRDAFPRSYGGRDCRWTPWVSEETPSVRFPSNHGAIRMQCRGRYCDDKRFFVCPIQRRR